MTIVTIRQEYYQQPYVLYNLVNQLKFRYLSARRINKEGKPILTRYYLGYSIPLLQQSLTKLNALNDQSIKLYFDLATWKDEKGNTPMFNFDSKKRKEDKEKFNDEFNKYMIDFDFAIDLDSDKDIMISWKDAKKIKKLFDEYKLPYSLKFSGGRGFHFLIEGKWFNPKMKAKNKVLLYGKLAKIIMIMCKIKEHDKGGTFDDSIYDDRRIFKIAYSLQNKDGKEYVCLPLSDEQFNNFRLEDMELMNVMKKNRLFKRGLLTRDYGLSEKELKKNVIKFIKEMK